MASTESCAVPLAGHADAAGRHFNNIPLDQLTAHRDDLVSAYTGTRTVTEILAGRLTAAQQCVQSMLEASPVKWHRAHTSWFFETFVLQHYEKRFNWFDAAYCYLFNSYYDGVGKQYPRAQRGKMSQPAAARIGSYRNAIDQRMVRLLESVDDQAFNELAPLVLLGLNHEQQHQELILTDFQHAWSLGAETPAPWPELPGSEQSIEMHWLEYDGGLVKTGYCGPCFAFDNEGPRHQYWLEPFSLANRPVTNADYLAFIDDGGYENPLLWLSDGWAWVQQNNISSPLYWRAEDGAWRQCNCAGIAPLNLDRPLVNICFYEASAFATWAAARLPTEHEWEYAMTSSGMASGLNAESKQSAQLPRLVQLAGSGLWLGNVWEWTASPYVAYPRFKPGSGAVGEYNGKFMNNQMVLRGYSGFTSAGHTRTTYRNFFYPDARWQQSGIRLARDAQA